ncbi:SUMF1/EgtB/PvdO family nonheme iron enzyme [Candidatus Hydrogenedentota bacterium]
MGSDKNRSSIRWPGLMLVRLAVIGIALTVLHLYASAASQKGELKFENENNEAIQEFPEVPAASPPLESNVSRNPSPKLADFLEHNFVAVPGGAFEVDESFVAGNSKRTVTVDDFVMQEYEVTNTQFVDYLNYLSSLPDGTARISQTVYLGKEFEGKKFSPIKFDRKYVVDQSFSNHPVVLVSWFGAAGYCNWLSKKYGLQECYDERTWACDFSKSGFRLPTEAEWEWALRGRENHRYSWGNSNPINWTKETAKANFADTNAPDWATWHETSCDDGFRYTAPVGTYLPNELGIFNLSGNVYEWCNDGWTAKLGSGEAKDPERFDLCAVEIQIAGEGDWASLNVWDSTRHNIPNWAKARVDLRPYAGKTVKIRFRFDSIDGGNNKRRGWYVDDVEVTGGSISWRDSMESPLEKWEATGLWHVVHKSHKYGEAHAGNRSFWYGQDQTGDYSIGTQTSGSLITPAIKLTDDVLELSFWHIIDTEFHGEGYAYKVLRGGSFLSSGKELSTSSRQREFPRVKHVNKGFRCVVSPEQAPDAGTWKQPSFVREHPTELYREVLLIDTLSIPDSLDLTWERDYVIDGDVLYFTTPEGLFSVHRKGLGWDMATPELIDAEVHGARAFFSFKGKFYYTKRYGSSYRPLRVSDDKGKTWRDGPILHGPIWRYGEYRGYMFIAEYSPPGGEEPGRILVSDDGDEWQAFMHFKKQNCDHVHSFTFDENDIYVVLGDRRYSAIKCRVFDGDNLVFPKEENYETYPCKGATTIVNNADRGIVIGAEGRSRIIDLKGEILYQDAAEGAGSSFFAVSRFGPWTLWGTIAYNERSPFPSFYIFDGQDMRHTRLARGWYEDGLNYNDVSSEQPGEIIFANRGRRESILIRRLPVEMLPDHIAIVRSLDELPNDFKFPIALARE